MSPVRVEKPHRSKSLPRIAGLVWSFLCEIKGNFWHFAVNACVSVVFALLTLHPECPPHEGAPVFIST